MQFTTVFFALAALATVAVASPAIVERDTKVMSGIISHDAMAHWIANTDAELTFIGERFNPLDKRAALATTVTYCTKRAGTICGGTCSVYTGGATCLATPGTVCMTSTRDIGYCDTAGCNGNCGDLAQCGETLENGFCFVPGTESVLVSPI
ncbi:hypothetical protein C8Q70DRAFT_249546 [Cubamyces menziesii]|uniref:Uncharacterized protein n=1 Tax=Trametes cubensis TaxID=1111947 RepID=A0AAD7U023_9APHY|nr:hypothetical protein C8Q70DRAFT_249546 [Cubamyces menziesii]KAJ8490014.1 hypothetical protein ONZ51_g2591 [Trametes cubensis]